MNPRWSNKKRRRADSKTVSAFLRVYLDGKKETETNKNISKLLNALESKIKRKLLAY